jgi:hypothetical protein
MMPIATATGASHEPVVLAALLVSAVAFAGAASAQDTDFSKVEIKTIDLGHNTTDSRPRQISRSRWARTASSWSTANSHRFTTRSTKLLRFRPLPVGYLVNTHFHGDHTAEMQGSRRMAPCCSAGQRQGSPGCGHDQWPNREQNAARRAGSAPKQTYIGGTITLEVGGRKASRRMSTMHTPTVILGSISDANVLAPATR